MGFAGAGASFDRAPASPLISKTKLAIVAVMHELGHPVTSRELQMIWVESRALSIFEYHLDTLVKLRVAELVADSDELRFRLSGSNQQGVEELLASMPLRAYRVKRV